MQYRILNSFVLIFLFMIGIISGFAQNGRKLPDIDLKDLSGKTISSSLLINPDGLLLVNFWATWCKPCIQELDNISEVYPEWVKETGVKLIAVSIDDTRNITKVAPFVNGRGWKYQILSDINSEFKRALNVNMIPHSFLLNKNGEIIWQNNSYAQGDEDELYELIKKESLKN